MMYEEGLAAMKAKEAIAKAKALLGDFYADEAIAEVRLEEVEFDEASDSWLITLGILRPPIETEPTVVAQAMGHDLSLARTYKIMKIPNSTANEPIDEDTRASYGRLKDARP